MTAMAQTSGQGRDTLGRFFDFGLGIFNTVIDRDNVQAELALARETRLAEEQRAAEAQARREAASMGAGVSIDNNMLLLAGGAIVAALIISRL